MAQETNARTKSIKRWNSMRIAAREKEREIVDRDEMRRERERMSKQAYEGRSACSPVKDRRI